MVTFTRRGPVNADVWRRRQNWMSSMSKYRPYFIAVGFTSVWAIFSLAYLGVEDGSSGLSLIGLVHAVIFLPGLLLMRMLKGSHANADIPLMALVGWMVFSMCTLLSVHLWLRLKGVYRRD